MASSDSAYAAAVLAIYLVLFFPAVYTAWKHGTRGLAWIGWGYFVVFCLLRVTGSAMQVADPGSNGAAVISSIGLSPLTIAAAGVLHEGRFYLFSLRRKPETNKIELIFVLVFHIVVAAAIALLAAGASGLASPKDEADTGKLDNDWNLAGGGALLVLLMLVVLFGVALFTYTTRSSRGNHHHHHHFRSRRSASRKQQQLARRLVLAVVIASPVLMIRVAGAVAYFFRRELKMNPSTGTWGFRVGLYLVPELLAAVVLLAGGLAARELRGAEEEEEEGHGRVVLG